MLNQQALAAHRVAIVSVVTASLMRRDHSAKCCLLRMQSVLMTVPSGLDGRGSKVHPIVEIMTPHKSKLCMVRQNEMVTEVLTLKCRGWGSYNATISKSITHSKQH